MTTLSIILIIVFALIGLFFLRTLYKFVKRLINLIKSYRKLGGEEFMKKAKEGAEMITPFQQTRVNLTGQIITFIGILAGCVVTPIVRINGIWWWMLIILGGSLVIQGVALFGTWQKYRVLKKQDEIMKELNMGEEAC